MHKPPLTIQVPARELREGDFVPGWGEITMIFKPVQTTHVAVSFDGHTVIFLREQKIDIHLEDDGRC